MNELFTFLETFNYSRSSGEKVDIGQVKTTGSLEITLDNNKFDRFSLKFRSNDFFAFKNDVTFSEIKLMLRIFDKTVLNEEVSKYHVTQKIGKMLLTTYFTENGFDIHLDIF